MMRNQSIDLSMLVFCNHHLTAIQYLNFIVYLSIWHFHFFSSTGLAHVLQFSTKSAMDDFVEANDNSNKNSKRTNNNQLFHSALVVSIGSPKQVRLANSGKR